MIYPSFPFVTLLSVDVTFVLIIFADILDVKTAANLREQLRAAIKESDRNALEKLILESEDTAYPELGADLRRARKTLEKLGGGRGG